MVKEETPSSYLPDWMPGMMSPNLLSTHSVVKPIFLATASKRSTSNPTILPFSLNSLGGYVSSVPILSFPSALMPAGTLATRPGSASVVGVGPPVPPPFFSSPHAANDSVSASPAASPSAAPLRKVVRNIALSYVDGGHDAVGACCQATPRYASLTAGSCSRSSPLPLLTIRPVSSTYPRCARVSACCAFCSTSRIGASPIDGSSSSISFGRLISARPTASICCSPPDNVPPGCLRRSANRGKRLKTRSMSARTAPPSRRMYAPISRFSCTVMPGKMPRPSGAWLMPRTTRRSARSFVMSSPAKRMRPDATGRMPEIARIVVDLPAPFAPIRATTSPSSTWRLMPCRARIRPYSRVMLSISSSIGRHPQVSGDHLRVVADLRGRTLGDLLAELQHDDTLRHTHDQPHVVLDEQDRDTGLADLPDQLEQALLLGRVEPGGRFVQAEQDRLGRQRPRDLEAALLTVRQVAGDLPRAPLDADEAQQVHRLLFAGPLLVPVPGQPEQGADHAGLVPGIGAHHRVLQRGHLGEQADVLEGTRHAQPGDLVLLAAGERHPPEPDLAGRGGVHPGHGVEAGGLAVAVRPDQAEDLALVEVERHPVERHHAAEAQRHIVDL